VTRTPDRELQQDMRLAEGIGKNVAPLSYVDVADLWVDARLKTFIEQDVLPGISIEAAGFWSCFSGLVRDLAPENRRLIDTRVQLQKQIDRWHIDHRNLRVDPREYKQFLRNIGYLAAEVDDFKIETKYVDDEIAIQAGPQLVVPLKNARFALNAANARWGSLYDALYGSDVVPDEGKLARSGQYNAVRGASVVAKGRDFLDQSAPLESGSHRHAEVYRVSDGQLVVELESGYRANLRHQEKFLGYRGSSENPTAVLLANNGLRFEIQIDASSPIGRNDKANIKDVLMESALTTIMDCEDSVAAIDAEDKLELYRNWLGLIKGSLHTTFEKSGSSHVTRLVERSLNEDRCYTAANGGSLVLPGRSLLFIRNVGHLMTTPAVLNKSQEEIPEGILDGVVTSLIALHDFTGNSRFRNSRKQSIYIVKPKMHGPEEVAFTNTLFERIESMLGLEKATIKLGIMDEERRTTLNLKSCIRQAKDRTVFINTGFLDRTGDEIHTSMQAGPMIPKSQMKEQPWIKAYEDWNVDVGLDCGLSGKAQIGKGMWPMPDRMADMVDIKIAHPKAGANTAWVPSPTAATLHAIHYHRVAVFKQQKLIQNRLDRDAELCSDTLLKPPLLVDRSTLTPDIIRAEIDNNCQGILGYVVRWIDQGIGCSKVLDINNVGLMEDRATLRISSQHLANWLLHEICSKKEIEDALIRMAAVVDQQNEDDINYQPMSVDPSNSIAFQAASDLIFLGGSQPSGYTEPLLHEYRKKKKRTTLE